METFLGQVEGPVYIFLSSHVVDNYTDSSLTISAFNKYNQAIEICERLGEIKGDDTKAFEELFDKALDREKQITEKLKRKGFAVIPGYISVIPIDRINEGKI